MTAAMPEPTPSGAVPPEGTTVQPGVSDQRPPAPPISSRPALPAGDEDPRVTLIQLMLEHMTIEGERFWQRNGVFITIATGLLGLYAVKSGDFFGVAHMAYGVVGLVIAAGWRQTIIASNYYAERWRVDAREYVKLHPDLADILRTVAGNSRVPEPTGPKSSVVMIQFAVLSAWFWGAVIAWGVVQLLFVPWPSSGIVGQPVCLQFENGKPITQVTCQQLERPALVQVDWSRLRALFTRDPPKRAVDPPNGGRK